MSAQPATNASVEKQRARERVPLRLLPSPRSILSPLGFGILIVSLIVAGLVTVMIVSTSVAAQSQELATLRKEAAELEYESAALTTQLQKRSSTSSLALRARQLGMVPNPYPAFIQLSDGKILGEPKAVEGQELPFLNSISGPDESRAAAEPVQVEQALQLAALDPLEVEAKDLDE